MKRILVFIIIIVSFAQAQKSQVKTQVEWAWGSDYGWFQNPKEDFSLKAQLNIPLLISERKITLNDSTKSAKDIEPISSLPFKLGIAFKLWDGFFQVDGGRILRTHESWFNSENSETPVERSLEINTYALAYKLNTQQKLSIGVRFSAYQIQVSETEAMGLNNETNNGDTLYISTNDQIPLKYQLDEFIFQPAFLIAYWGSYFQFKPTITSKPHSPESIPDSLKSSPKIEMPSEFELGYQNSFFNISLKYWLGEYKLILPWGLSNWNEINIIPRFSFEGQLFLNRFILNMGGAWVEGIKTPGSISMLFPQIPFVDSQLDFIPLLNLTYQWGQPLTWSLGLTALPQASLDIEVSYGW